jgi:hypothetical protein
LPQTKWKEEKQALRDKGQYLIDQYKKEGISFPKGATSFTSGTCYFLNKKSRENLMILRIFGLTSKAQRNQ